MSELYLYDEKMNFTNFSKMLKKMLKNEIKNEINN